MTKIGHELNKASLHLWPKKNTTNNIKTLVLTTFCGKDASYIPKSTVFMGLKQEQRILTVFLNTVIAAE